MPSSVFSLQRYNQREVHIERNGAHLASFVTNEDAEEIILALTLLDEQRCLNQ